MKCKVRTLGCDTEYGTERTIFEDEQVGDATVREMELGSLHELYELSQEVTTVEIHESTWDRYDWEVILVCG